MKILLTGSSGRIGAYIAHQLSRHHTVLGMDLKVAPQTTVVGNILNEELVHDLCSQVEAVVHTAALHAPQVGVAANEEFYQTNVVGHENLLRHCLAAGVKKFVYTSTTSLYGEALVPINGAAWITEDVEPIPRDIYDETKLAAENLCAEASREGMHCVSLRMSRCFPEPEHLMAIYRLYRGVDRRDVADAHELALQSSRTGFDIYNISAKSPFVESDIEELMHNAASVILKYYPSAKQAFARRIWRMPTKIDRVYVIDKAMAELGYNPRFNFQQYIANNP